MNLHSVHSSVFSALLGVLCVECFLDLRLKNDLTRRTPRKEEITENLGDFGRVSQEKCA